MTRLRWRRSSAFLGLALAALLGYALVRQADLVAVARLLERAEFWPWIPLGALVHLFGHLVRGARTRVCLSQGSRIGTVECTAAVVAGYASNNVLPARLGELVRMRMLARASGLSFASAAGVVLLERVADVAILFGAALLAGGGALVGASSAFAWPGASPWLVLAAVLFASSVPLGVWLAKRLAPQFRDKAAELVAQLLTGARYLSRPSVALGFVGLSGAVWILESAVFALVFVAFGLLPDPRSALETMSLTNLGLIAPSAPGYVGSFHFFCARALAFAGVPTTTGLAVAAVTHLTLIVPTSLAGLWVALRQLSERRPEPSVGSVESIALRRGQARSMRALVTALVPPAPTLARASEQQILADVVRFLEAQLGDLPFRLKLAMRAGLLAVGMLSWLRYGEALSALDAERRREFVERLAYGRFWPFRALFRPLRANVLIAYYDHPLFSERRVVPELIQLHAG